MLERSLNVFRYFGRLADFDPRVYETVRNAGKAACACCSVVSGAPLFGAIATGPSMILVNEAYDGEMRLFRAKRDAALRAEDGWLSTTGLVVLDDGENDLGFGTVTVRGDSVRLAVRAGEVVTYRSAPVREAWLRPDQDEDVLHVGRTSHQLIRRGETLAIRSRNPEAHLRRSFPGPDWYPINANWRVKARAVPLDRPRRLELSYSVAAQEVHATDYILAFKLQGVHYALEPIVEPKRLFVLFRDMTNGESTCDIGRYLYAPLPHNGHTVLDFNMALTPGCAFSEHVMYPVPPKRNMLHLRVESGEKAPRIASR